MVLRKILLWGDEGSGKSTLAALLARYAVAGGWSVLLVDAGGELSMPDFLGLARPRMTLVEEMGGPDYVRRIYPSVHESCPVPDLSVDNLPSSCLSRRDNLALLSLGAEFLEQVGPSPLGWLFRDFLGRLDDTGWWIFVDGGPWFEEAGDALVDVIDGVLEVDIADEDGSFTSCTKARKVFAGQDIPLFPVVNRVVSPAPTLSGETGSVPLAFFPCLERALSVPPDGRGLAFPRDFLDPLRGTWEVMMSRFASSHTSRAGSEVGLRSGHKSC